MLPRTQDEFDADDERGVVHVRLSAVDELEHAALILLNERPNMAWAFIRTSLIRYAVIRRFPTEAVDLAINRFSCPKGFFDDIALQAPAARSPGKLKLKNGWSYRVRTKPVFKKRS
jgi:hypothetical protein